MDDDPFGNAPLNKGLNKKRLASPKPGSPAQLSIQKPAVKKAPDAIHEDLLCLSMDTSPASHSNGVEQEASAPNKKQKNFQPEPSSRSPQMSTRSSKIKYGHTGAAIEALDNHPVLEPQRGTAENQRPTTSENIQTSKPKDKPAEPFDFVSDLLKTSSPKDAPGKSAKMKISKSDTGLSNGQTKTSVTTESSKRDAIHATRRIDGSEEYISDDIDMESNSSQENQEKFTMSSSPVF